MTDPQNPVTAHLAWERRDRSIKLVLHFGQTYRTIAEITEKPDGVYGTLKSGVRTSFGPGVPSGMAAAICHLLSKQGVEAPEFPENW